MTATRHEPRPAVPPCPPGKHPSPQELGPTGPRALRQCRAGQGGWKCKRSFPVGWWVRPVGSVLWRTGDCSKRQVHACCHLHWPRRHAAGGQGRVHQSGKGPRAGAWGSSRCRRLPVLLCLPQADGLDEPGAWVSWVLGGQGSCQVQSRDPDSGSGVRWPQLQQEGQTLQPRCRPVSRPSLPLPHGDGELGPAHHPGPGAGRQAPGLGAVRASLALHRRGCFTTTTRHPEPVLPGRGSPPGPELANPVRPATCRRHWVLGAWFGFCPRSQCMRRPGCVL